MEIWVNIPNSNYSVSNLGNVKSLDRIVTYKRYCGKEVKRFYKGTFLKLQNHNAGYKHVTINKKISLVHRLVASSFLHKDPFLNFVNHKDGNKHNNFVDNLEWCTRQDNEKHAFAIGLKNSTGEMNTMSKLKDADVIEIKRSERTREMKFLLVDKFSVNRATIERIWNNKIWKHV